MTVIESRMRRRQRVVSQQIVVQADLVLHTPTHLGNGDTEGVTDMALLVDAVSQQALLTGASLAGALRAYLLTRQHGYRKREGDTTVASPDGTTAEVETLPGNDQPTPDDAELLFGGRKGDDGGIQSPLIVNDAFSVNPTPGTLARPRVELRDGVRIDAARRTAMDGAKYDLELLAAGTTFPIYVELAILADHDTPTEQRLRQLLVTALDGLGRGEIAMGMKKRRGFGQCRIASWQVWDFDLHDPVQLRQWLTFERNPALRPAHKSDLAALLLPNTPPAVDRRQRTMLEATFTIPDSLIIRAGQDALRASPVPGATPVTVLPDAAHLVARQVGPQSSVQPVVSGTALAGVLRHRAERILTTIAGPKPADELVSALFGSMIAGGRGRGAGSASRLVVHESVIHAPAPALIQQRVKIDRLSGGAYDTALFNSQPVWGQASTRVELKITLEQPAASTIPEGAQIGLLLLLLKDLWTGDLPIGGESSIGRGRLTGHEATLSMGEQRVTLTATPGFGLSAAQRAMLEQFVTDLHIYLKPAGSAHATT